MKNLIFVAVLCLPKCLSGFKGTKPYINEFFFKLSDEKFLHVVQIRAKIFNFKWLRHVITRLHLFQKTDIPVNAKEPVSDHEVSHWMNAFGSMVEYIEQDKYIQVYPLKREHESPDKIIGGGSQAKHWAPYRHRRTTTDHKQEATTFHPESTPRVPDLRNPPLKTLDAGKTVKIAVLDAFFDTKHRNLQESIIKWEAYNFVDGNHKTTPDEFPDDFFEEHYPELYHIYSHGTMCMGRITSSAEYGCNEGGDVRAKIIPVKFIDDNGYTRDEYEVAALKYMNNDIDIYSCSFGTTDNAGFSTKVMTPIEDALAGGVSMGRHCKGSIYLFPSGNGNGLGRLDNCNTDIYAANINTITIASITMSNEIAAEAETCPCALVASFGSPAPSLDRHMNTTKPKNKCTHKFRGSSAATAFAAGMISHALREKPDLSKRDIEFLLIQTANTNLHSSVKWRKNAAGYKFNEKIGFGAIDLDALKVAAKTWAHVPEKHVCTIYTFDGLGGSMTGRTYATEYKIRSNACIGTQHSVRYLEHVQLEVQLSTSNISEIAINLFSPMRTKVGMLTKIKVTKKRKVDYQNLNWTFMAVQFWGEDPKGDWKVELNVDGTQDVTVDMHIKRLILHGTTEHPSVGGEPLQCKFESSDTCLPVCSLTVIGLLLVVTCISIPLCVLCWQRKRRGNNDCSSPREYEQQAAENLSLDMNQDEADIYKDIGKDSSEEQQQKLVTDKHPGD